MKLVDLVAYFRNGGTFEDFCKTQALDAGAEVIEIYAQSPVGLESKLRFFPLEETGGQTEVVSDGAKYQSLFDFFYFLEAIGEPKSLESPEDAALAQMLLSYALKDA